MKFGNVSSYFDRFKNISLPNEEVRKATANAIEKEIGITVDISKIRVVQNSLKIEVTPLIKSEIFLKKERILEEIKKQCKEKTPNDIR